MGLQFWNTTPPPHGFSNLRLRISMADIILSNTSISAFDVHMWNIDEDAQLQPHTYVVSRLSHRTRQDFQDVRFLNILFPIHEVYKNHFISAQKGISTRHKTRYTQGDSKLRAHMQLKKQKKVWYPSELPRKTPTSITKKVPIKHHMELVFRPCKYYPRPSSASKLTTRFRFPKEKKVFRSTN